MINNLTATSNSAY